MKKPFTLFLITLLLLTAYIVHAEAPSGCVKFASNGVEFCDDDRDFDKVISGGGSFKFTVENNGGGTFYIAESSAIPGRCQDFGNFDTPPFPTVKTLSPSDNGKSVTLPPSHSGMYTLGSYGGNSNRGYLCPGGDGSDAGSGPSDGTSSGGNTGGASSNPHGGAVGTGASNGEIVTGLPPATPGVCTTDTDLDCERSDKVLSAACKNVVSGLYTYQQCDSQKITLTYNLQTLACGDELGLRIAKYDGAGGWTPLPDSNVESNGDGTGTVTATINSDAIFAVVTTTECSTQCFDNVFDTPDPVLGGSSVTLGACGSLISPNTTLPTPITDKVTVPDFDAVAPALFIIRRDECNANQSITSTEEKGAACPKGYDFSGSFKVGNEIDGCSGTQQYTGLAKTSKGYKTTTITKGWVDLCTKNNIAYLEDARDECLVNKYKDDTGTFFVQGEDTLYNGNNGDQYNQYCGEGKVLCGVRNGEGLSNPNELVVGYCCTINTQLKDAVNEDGTENIADPAASLESAYCSSENSVGTGIKFSTFKDHAEFDAFYCSATPNAQVIRSEQRQLLAADGTSFCNEVYGPDYAVCGGTNNAQSSGDEIGNVYCCQIKETLTPCKEGYSLIGTIKVNNNDPNRCNVDPTQPYTEYGWTADGQKIISGHIGICVKDNDIEQLNQPLLSIPTSVTSGTVGSASTPEDAYLIGTLTTAGTYDQALFPTLTSTSGEENTDAALQTGTLGLFVKLNQPLASFCATPTFEKGKCTEELCSSTDGTLICEATTTAEDAVQDYYGFICDFSGCPSVTFKGTSSTYYGTGNYQICSSSEACGLVGVSSECIDVDQDGYCTLGVSPDCDDANMAVNPGAIDICDGLDNNCDNFIDENDDLDLDGVSTCATTPDCDDTNSTIAPGMGELCGNGVDEDCDGEAPACPACLGDTTDIDMDGQCSDLDCNDNNNTIYLNATDICGDGIDQDCSGSDAQCPQCTPGSYRTCFSTPESTTYTYHQLCDDNELWGLCAPDYELGVPPPKPAPACTDGQVLSCPRQYGVCAGSTQICTGGAWPGCNYANIQSYSTTDTCGDYLDNDCDGSTDEGCACIEGQETACGSDIGECTSGKQTCTNGKWGSCHDQKEAVPEIFLDQKDNDCDGSIDEGFDCSQSFGLGFSRSCGGPAIGICKPGVQTCTDKLFDGLTVLSACVDAVNPHTEICNDLDDDCDGSIDEGCGCTIDQKKTCGIGIGICTTGSQICSNGTFTECLNVTLPKEEKCGNNLDDDCDGTADEGCACSGNQTTTLCTKQFGVCNGTVAHCINGKFEDCNAIYGNLTKYQPLENACTDNLDNDCDNKTDSMDPTNCDDSSSSSLKCSDGTPLNTCVNKGKSPIFCNSNAELVELCSTCDPTCDPGSTTCDIKGRCVVETNPQDDTPTYNPPGETNPPNDNGDTGTSESGSSWSTYLIIGLIIIALLALVFIFLKMRKKKEAPKTPLTPMQIHAIERPAITQKDLKEVKQANNTSALKEYIQKSLTQGKKISEIRELCKKAGWTDAEITSAMPATPAAAKTNPNETLEHYAIYSFKKGMKDTEIRNTLLKAGWKAQDVDKALLNGKLALAREVSQSISDQQQRKEEQAYADKKLDEMTKKDSKPTKKK